MWFYRICAGFISYSYYIKIMELDERVRTIELEMASHEAQCEERWKTTFNRLQDIDESLQRIESRVMAGGGAIILFMLGLLATHWMS